MACRYNRNAGAYEGREEREKRLSICFIKVRYGFVGKNDHRAIDDGPGEKRQLLFAGGKSSGQGGSKFADAAFFKREKGSAARLRVAPAA